MMTKYFCCWFLKSKSCQIFENTPSQLRMSRNGGRGAVQRRRVTFTIIVVVASFDFLINLCHSTAKAVSNNLPQAEASNWNSSARQAKNGGEENKIVNKISAGRLPPASHSPVVFKHPPPHSNPSPFAIPSQLHPNPRALFLFSVSHSVRPSVKVHCFPVFALNLPCNISCFFHSRWLSPSYCSLYTEKKKVWLPFFRILHLTFETYY